nr:serine hydrolase [Brevibacterium sp. CFH 10365]
MVTEPGTDFIYSSGTSHMLAVCVQQAVGERLDEYLRPRLFNPLGFIGHTWSTDPEGFNSGGNGLSLRTVDLLKWGVLHLRGGEWNGTQLLPASWVEESTTWHVAASHSTWNGSGYSAAAGDGDEGYGYQIWLQDGAYYASGMFGQVCVVVPDAERVIAVNAALERSQARELVGDLIELAREGAQQAGRVSCAGRRMPIAAEPSELCSGVAGEYMSTDGASSLTVRHVDADTGSSPMSGPRLHHSYVDDEVPIAARVEQTGRSELTVTIDYLSAPFVDTLTLAAATDGGLTLTRSANVNSTDASSITTSYVRSR